VQLHLATLGSAEALSLDHRIGNFLPGKEAHFVVLDP
jgi:guanine deaminase